MLSIPRMIKPIDRLRSGPAPAIEILGTAISPTIEARITRQLRRVRCTIDVTIARLR